MNEMREQNCAIHSGLRVFFCQPAVSPDVGAVVESLESQDSLAATLAVVGRLRWQLDAVPPRHVEAHSVDGLEVLGEEELGVLAGFDQAREHCRRKLLQLAPVAAGRGAGRPGELLAAGAGERGGRGELPAGAERLAAGRGGRNG